MKNIVTLQCQKKRGEKEPLANTRGLFLFVILGVGFGEAADDDFAGVAALEVFVEDAGGDAGGFGLGEAIDAGADAGEGDALEVVFLSQSHGGIVAGGEQLALVVAASIPDGAYGMNDFLARQVVGVGHLALASVAAAQRSALFQQSLACCAVDGAVDASPTQQRTVGCIHNGINF